MVTLRFGALLEERQMTPYRASQIAQEKGLPLSLSTAHRLARDQWRSLDRETLDAVCAVLDCQPGELFERQAKRRKAAAV